MVFGGTDTQYLKDIIKKNFTLDVFHFVSEITSIKKDLLTHDVTINEKYTLSDYHAFILCDSSTIYNYLWNEASDVPWYHSPFDLRTASNHNFYSSIAKTMRFVLPPAIPNLNAGKVNVTRDFPKGKEIRFLLMHNEVVPLTSIEMSKTMQKSCKAFLRSCRVQFGIVTFILNRSSNDLNEMLFKEFTPIIDWGSLTESQIKSVIEKVLFSAKVVAAGKRVKLR